MKVEYVSDKKLGIYLYKNQLTKDLDLPKRIEEVIKCNENEDLENSPFSNIRWQEALVGYRESMPEYRDCFDFKVNSSFAESCKNTQFDDVYNIYSDVQTRLQKCLDDYCSNYNNIKMEFMESINFVKYEKNHHFQVHSDHGFSYICTISSVMYLNDEYEGGELYFPYLDVKIKPEYGDIVLFPSTFIYAHASLPIVSGTKYSAVTMFDYNDSPCNKVINRLNKKILNF